MEEELSRLVLRATAALLSTEDITPPYTPTMADAKETLSVFLSDTAAVKVESVIFACEWLETMSERW